MGDHTIAAPCTKAVLGGLSDGDPFGTASPPFSCQKQLDSRVLSHGLDTGRQTAPGDGRSRPQSVVGAGRDRRNLPALSGPRTTPPASAPGEAMTRQVARGRWHPRWATATSRLPIAPGRSHRLRCRQSQRRSSPVTSPRRCSFTAKTDGWAGYAGVPVNQHRSPRHRRHGRTSCLALDPSDVLRNLKGWARGVYHGLRRKYLQTYLDEPLRSSASTDAERGTPPVRSLFAIAIRAKPGSPRNMLVAPEQSA